MVAAYNELSTGELRLGPPKSAAGRRIVALPKTIVPELARHVAEFAAPGADGLVFVGPKCAPLRRSNFSKAVPWRAAIIYQHATAQRDRVIAEALDGLASAARRADDTEGPEGSGT